MGEDQWKVPWPHPILHLDLAEGRGLEMGQREEIPGKRWR